VSSVPPQLVVFAEFIRAKTAVRLFTEHIIAAVMHFGFAVANVAGLQKTSLHGEPLQMVP
jgi:hypothetical protein